MGGKTKSLILLMGAISIGFLLREATASQASPERPVVLIKTELGDITARIYLDKAPITAGNFMRYVDAELYDDTNFFRVVTREESAPNPAVAIEVVQGGQVEETREYPPIAHETTAATGLKHLDGALSIARSAPGTATSSFSIIINDQPAMDFGGKRNPDGQGFAVFGYVISGMDVARKIHRSPHERQRLTPPVAILSIRRLE